MIFNKFFESNKDKQEGSAMLITTIIVTALLIIVATTINMAGRQMDLATLNRNTSNTYYLAKSAVEKQAELMNVALDEELSYIINEMNTSIDPDKNYITQLINEGENIEYVPPIIDASNVVTKKGLIKVDNTTIRNHLSDSLYNALQTKFITGESLIYTAQGDRADNDNKTEIKIDITETTSGGNNAFKIMAKATTKSGSSIYDEQMVEAIVEIRLPDDIINEIHEKYDFIKEEGQDIVPDILKGAITCYSDLIVGDYSGTDSGEPESSTLEVQGDVYVGGKPNIQSYTIEDSLYAESDERNTRLYPEPDQNGGIIVTNGGKLNIIGNAYTTRNILTTSGWGLNGYNKESQIIVTKDAMAHTIGIIDDFYKDSENQNPFAEANQVSRNKIKVNGNVMVDNDVMIDRWVRDSEIEVSGSIYGINSGSDSSSESADAGDIDPNQSSGVFSQGPGSKIKANQMLIAGQPYITLKEGQKPMKLWESIGEPFDGIASYGGYVTGVDNIDNESYLFPDSPFYNMIAKDKIETHFDKTYAIARVSGKDSADGIEKAGETCTNILNNQSEATKFFSQGEGNTNFSSTVDPAVDASYTAGIQGMITNIDDCYNGKHVGTAKKIEGTFPENNYKGVRGYMTAKRNVLYKEFIDGNIVTQTFDEATNGMLPGGSNPSKLLSAKHVWTYKTPIVVTDPTIESEFELDVREYYVTDENGTNPHPSIIINTTGEQMNLISGSTENKEFYGVIISNGPVYIEDGITINGSIIVGTPNINLDPKYVDRKIILNGANKGITVGENVKVIGDSAMILKVRAENEDLYREILTMLGVTHYDEYIVKSESQIKDIMGMKDQHIYGKKILNYTDESVLEVNTESMEIAITGLKKVQ